MSCDVPLHPYRPSEGGVSSSGRWPPTTGWREGRALAACGAAPLGLFAAQPVACPSSSLGRGLEKPEDDERDRACFEDYADLIVPDTDGEDAEVSEHERGCPESEVVSSWADPGQSSASAARRLGRPCPRRGRVGHSGGGRGRPEGTTRRAAATARRAGGNSTRTPEGRASCATSAPSPLDSVSGRSRETQRPARKPLSPVAPRRAAVAAVVRRRITASRVKHCSCPESRMSVCYPPGAIVVPLGPDACH